MRVHFQVVEGTRRRTQVFEGVVIKRQGTGARETFTVRKQSFGVGVERTFPVHSPKIERIEVASRGDVRRAKLYYLRDRVGRALAGARAPLDGRRGAGLRRRRDAARRRAAPRRGGAGEARGGVPTEARGRERSAGATRRGRRARAARRGGCPRRSRRRTRCRRPPPSAEADAEDADEPDDADEPRPTGPSPRRLGPVALAVGGHKRRRAPAARCVELVTIVAVALGLALGIQAFLVKPFRIPSESMVPTLEIGQRVLVDRVSFRFSDPDRGDIVVFKPPEGADTNTCGVEQPETALPDAATKERSDTNFIKRVVAVGGDRIKVIDGAVYLNGKRQKEPFARLDSRVRALQHARGDHDSARASTT